MVESLLSPSCSPASCNDVEEFLTDLELADKKPKTINNYRYVLAPFFRFTKKRFAKEVTVLDIRRYFAEYKKTHKHNSYWIISERLKTFFKKYNPPIADYVKNLKIREEPREIETFTPEERQEFLEAVLNFGETTSKIVKLRDTAVWELLSETAMRIEEGCSLNLENVDFAYEKDPSVVHFHLIKTKGKRDKPGKPRNNYVPRNSKAIQLLEQYLRLRDDLSPSAPLFVSQLGNRLRPERIQAKFRTIKAKLGIKKRFTPHGCKHTRCTDWLVKKEKNVKTVSEYVGTNPETLLKTYVHPKEEDLRELGKTGMEVI